MFSLFYNITEDLILSDFQFQERFVRFTLVPLKPSSEQNVNDILVRSLL